MRVGAPGVAVAVPPELDQCNCASMMIVRSDGSFVSEWMVHAFNSPALRWQVDIVKYGAAQKQFNISHAVNFWFPVPPKEEQEYIVEYLCNSIRRAESGHRERSPRDRALERVPDPPYRRRGDRQARCARGGCCAARGPIRWPPRTNPTTPSIPAAKRRSPNWTTSPRRPGK